MKDYWARLPFELASSIAMPWFDDWAHRISGGDGDGDGDDDGDAGGQRLFLQVQCLSKFALRPKQPGEAGMEFLWTLQGFPQAPSAEWHYSSVA